MEHKKMAKSHGILLSVKEFDQCCPWIVPNLYVYATTKNLSIDVESPHFPMISAKWCKCKIKNIDGHGKLRISSGINSVLRKETKTCEPGDVHPIEY